MISLSTGNGGGNMIAINKLKAQMVLCGVNQEELAKKLGMTSKTLSLRMKKGLFTSVEMEIMIDILKIHEPAEIFFAK